MYPEDISTIQYHIVESTNYEPTTTNTCFFGSDCPTRTSQSIRSSNCSSEKHNETLALVFHSSLICFKIALCVLL